MTNVLSTFVKYVCVKFLCCCARVLQCQPRWRPIANHLYDGWCIERFHSVPGEQYSKDGGYIGIPDKRIS